MAHFYGLPRVSKKSLSGSLSASADDYVRYVRYLRNIHHVAAIVSLESLRLLERLEDEYDVAEARKALEENVFYDLDDVLKSLGS